MWGCSACILCMRSRIVLGLLVPLVIVSGCVHKAAGEKPSPAMISDELLTITDMPGTWNETQRQAFSIRGAENPSIDPSIWCPEAATVTKNLIDLAGNTGADVEMQLASKTGVRRMMRLQAWANDDVNSYFRDAKEAARICDGKVSTDDMGATSTTSIIDNRDIGDESISWSQKVVPPAGTEKDKMESIGRTTIARFGDILMVMQLGDAAEVGTSTLMNEDSWWKIVEKAGQKLNSLDERVHD